MRLSVAVFVAFLVAAACDRLPSRERADAGGAGDTSTAGATSPDTIMAEATGPDAASAGAPRDGRRIEAGGMLARTGYTTLDSVAFDVDRDGHREVITVAATVERSATGQPLWEDGHHWALVARHASTQYVLLEEFVPWGGMRFWVTRPETGGPARILALIEGMSGGTGAFALREFRFDDAARIYIVADSIMASGPMARSTMVPP